MSERAMNGRAMNGRAMNGRAINAEDFRRLMGRWADAMAEHKQWLIELDGVVGDSDLGLTMSDGFRAAADAIADSPEADVGKLAYLAGKAMAAAVPSTMGTLMASGLMQAGKALRGVEQLNAEQQAAFFRAYYEGVKARGKAELGDKTFLDAMHPAVMVLQAQAAGPADRARPAKLAAEAARQAFENTKGMLAKHGRMAIRGERSRELVDPGAAVAVLLMEGYAQFQLDGTE